jgi:oxygen-dependent protoporphyrinogen oxidase
VNHLTHKENKNMTKNIAVIGGGISGLCAAYWLKKEGFGVQLFERTDRVGGVIRSDRSDDFLVDLGPNSTLETSEVLKELVRELELEDQKVYGNDASGKRYILKNGELTPIPTSPLAFIRSGLFSWKAKLRLLKEPFLKPTSGEDIALADFVRYRLGQEFLDYAINPFVAGVYAGDPQHLSTATGFPKLYALEQKYGSLIKGTVQGIRARKKRKEVAKNRARMFSFKGGMQVLTDALAANLAQEIHTNTLVNQLTEKDGRYQLVVEQNGSSQNLSFDSVVVCVPTFAMRDLLSSVALPEELQRLSDVYYPPVSVVFTGFRKESVPRELDGFGFLIPEVENRSILGSLWSSAIFPGRAPEGHVAFTSFVGGTRQPNNALLPNDDLTRLVLEELEDILNIKEKPVFVRVKKWERAIPQYRMGYQKVQSLLDNLENRFPGIYFAGNYRRGISVGDSVLSAFDVVEKIR